MWLYALAVPAALLLFAGMLYQYIGEARDQRRHGPPGRRVRVDGFRMHLCEMGSERPVVILESGIGATSLNWSRVQAEVALFARVVSYDRAGLGWSDRGDAARTCSEIVRELRSLIRAAGLPGPFVLVGHSFGGAVVRVFANRFPDEVAGMVLVDAMPPEQWTDPPRARMRDLRGAVRLSRLGAWLARFGVVRLCLALLAGGKPGVPERFSRVFGARASSLLKHIVGEVQKLPREVIPQVHALWCLPRCFRAMADHLAVLPESASEAAAVISLGDIPLIVLAAGDLSRDGKAAQEGIARLSRRGRLVVAEGAGHWIHLDRPDLVVEAVREIVTGAEVLRDSSPAPGGC